MCDRQDFFRLVSVLMMSVRWPADTRELGCLRVSIQLNYHPPPSPLYHHEAEVISKFISELQFYLMFIVSAPTHLLNFHIFGKIIQTLNHDQMFPILIMILYAH